MSNLSKSVCLLPNGRVGKVLDYHSCRTNIASLADHVGSNPNTFPSEYLNPFTTCMIPHVTAYVINSFNMVCYKHDKWKHINNM